MFLTSIEISKSCKKIYKLPEFAYGKWKLRHTNNKNVFGQNYLIIKNQNDIKFKTILKKNLYIEKSSRSGNIIIEKNKNNIYQITLVSNKKTFYIYSLFGIKIPDIKFINNESYNKKLSVICKIENNSLIITKESDDIFYIFDIDSSNDDNLHVEISLQFFIFSQIISTLFGIAVNDYFNN